MSTCFENIIGIKGQCGTVTEPSSGLYVNDLPFINLKIADSIINNDDDDAVSFIQNKINYAAKATEANINALLAPMFKQSSVLESALLGRYQETLTALSSSAKRRGIQIKIWDYPYLEFNLTGISLYSSNTTGDVTIKVHDLITGQELDSFTVAVTAGEIEYVPVNKRYLTNGSRFNILISYDATTVNAYETTLTASGSGCYECYKNSGYKSGRYMQYNGAEISTGSSVLYNNLTFTGHSAGLSVQYNIGCAPDGFLCSIKNQLAWPILHKTGAEICREVVNGSQRVNSVTTIDREKAAVLMEDFEMQYTSSIQNILHNLQITDDTCFRCKQRIRTSVRVP